MGWACKDRDLSQLSQGIGSLEPMEARSNNNNKKNSTPVTVWMCLSVFLKGYCTGTGFPSEGI